MASSPSAHGQSCRKSIRATPRFVFVGLEKERGDTQAKPDFGTWSLCVSDDRCVESFPEVENDEASEPESPEALRCALH